ncbi:hypothetical protein [Kocuria palustris]|uniref:hypothetical protein n=1 Tax=Kocuria palustris TaxID=71999 RepID=UPI00331F7763
MNLPNTSSSVAARLRDDRGESSVGLLMITPAIGVLILMAVVAGRLGAAQTSLEAAAGVAAREATLAGAPAAGHANAASSVHMTLDQADFTCTSQSLQLDTAALLNAPGIPGEVTATLTCTVPLGDLAVPGVPGTWELTAEARSPVDTYRERN